MDSGALSDYYAALDDAPVAQLDRVLPSEGRGHWFESSRVHHIRKAISPGDGLFYGLFCTVDPGAGPQGR